jgi:electron transfer flavoprotein beta subunit
MYIHITYNLYHCLNYAKLPIERDYMKIAVCIKQVPDTAEVKINPETGTLMREGVPSIINPYDTHALEAAVQLKEQYGATVTVVTMGPPQAADALKECISRGADDAVLLTDRAFAGSDTWATSYALSSAMKKIEPDLIICGKQAIDGDTAQVGPGMAEMLDMPHVAYVRKVESAEDGVIKVHRLMDDGYDVVEAKLPALLTVVKEINEPRMPSMKGKMKARKAEIPNWSAADIGAEAEKVGLTGSPTQVKNIFAPEMKSDREMVEGTPEEKATKIIEKLREMKCL